MKKLIIASICAAMAAVSFASVAVFPVFVIAARFGGKRFVHRHGVHVRVCRNRIARGVKFIAYFPSDEPHSVLALRFGQGKGIALGDILRAARLSVRYGHRIISGARTDLRAVFRECAFTKVSFPGA